MPYFHIQSFQAGIDARKANLAGVPGSLARATNLHLDRGGQLEKRRAIDYAATLPTNTRGLFAENNRVWTFGSVPQEALSSPLPAGVSYMQMSPPGGQTLRRLLSATAFDGKIYAIGLYEDGSIHHFYDGQWIEGISSKMPVGSSIRNSEQLTALFEQKIRLNSNLVNVAFVSPRRLRLTGRNEQPFFFRNASLAGVIRGNAPIVADTSIQTARLTDPNIGVSAGDFQNQMFVIGSQYWAVNILPSYAWVLTMDITRNYVPPHGTNWNLEVYASPTAFQNSDTGAPDQYAAIRLVGMGQGGAWEGGSSRDYAKWLVSQINANRSNAHWVRNGLNSGPLLDRVNFYAVANLSVSHSDPHHVYIVWQPKANWLVPQYPGHVQFLTLGGLSAADITPIGRPFGYPGSPAPWLPPQGPVLVPGRVRVRFTDLGRFQRILAINSTWRPLQGATTPRNFLTQSVDVPDQTEIPDIAMRFQTLGDRLINAATWGGSFELGGTPEAPVLDVFFSFPPLGHPLQPLAIWRDNGESVYVQVSNPEIVTQWRGQFGRPQITDIEFPKAYNDRDIYRLVLSQGNNVERYEKVGLSGGSAASEAGLGTFALTHRRKVFVTHQSILYFSALNNPAVWDPENTQFPGAGFINMANQTKGSQRLTGLATYNGRLAVFSEDAVQIWQIDENDEASRLEQTINGIGTRYPLSIQPFGSGEVLFLSDQGVRSLGQRVSMDGAFINDIGMPVDDPVREALRLASPDDLNSICSCVEPMDGRYWLAIGRQVFVLSYFPNSKVVGWTTYQIDEISDGQRIDYLWVGNRQVYARAGDEVFVYDQLNGRFNRVPVSVISVFLDNGKPAHRKKFQGIDMTLECGQQQPVVVSAYYAPAEIPPIESRERLADPGVYPAAPYSTGNATFGMAEVINGVQSRTLYDPGRIPLVGRGHHIAFAVTQGWRDEEMPEPALTFDRTDIKFDNTSPTWDDTRFGVSKVRVKDVRETGERFVLAEVMIHFQQEDDR